MPVSRGVLQHTSPSPATGTQTNNASYVKIIDYQNNPILTTENGYLSTNLDSLVLFEQVDGNSLNTNVWAPATVGAMTVTQTNGFIALNGGLSTAVGSAMIQSIKTIPLYGHLPVVLTDTQRFFHVILQMPIGTATILQIIRGDVFIMGYFE